MGEDEFAKSSFQGNMFTLQNGIAHSIGCHIVRIR